MDWHLVSPVIAIKVRLSILQMIQRIKLNYKITKSMKVIKRRLMFRAAFSIITYQLVIFA